MEQIAKFIMQNLKLIILVLFLSLIGCAIAPQKLGISEQEWLSYSDAQRQKILTDYQQINAIKEQQEQDAKKIKGNTTDSINVAIYGGEVMMPPFTEWYEFQSVTFNLIQNTCSDTLLNQSNGKAQVSLRACYKDNIFYLDPSRYDLAKNNGSISFPFSPLWKQGFEYSGVSSSGYVRLKNATVKIIVGA